MTFGLSGGAFAQADNPAPAAEDQVTVRGEKSLSQYRVELDRAREDIFRRFNEANAGEGTDVRCRNEQPTGSRMRQNVCRSSAEDNADAAAARGFLTALLNSAGNFRAPLGGSGGGTQVNANIGTGVAQSEGQTGEADALGKFEAEWRRLLSEDQDLFQAVRKYAELQDEYDRARGAVIAPISTPVAATVAESSAPRCEATTLTEYYQRGTVAHVSGRVGIASCPAGSTGTFTITARVRDESGEPRPIEFNETWQRADAGDHTFESDYPIGDDVELMNVRVRGLKCTCAEAAQP